MSRSFTVDSVYNMSGKKMKFKGGRYMSEIPSNAARKAFSQISHNKKGKLSLEIHLKETTQNSSNKIYKYKITRVNKPTVVTKGDTTIVFRYLTKVKAI